MLAGNHSMKAVEENLVGSRGSQKYKNEVREALKMQTRDDKNGWTSVKVSLRWLITDD